MVLGQDHPRNPIQERVDFLAALWNDFAQDGDARVLRWVVDDDGARLVDLLVEIQAEQGVGELPDLFIRFDAPFEDRETYPRALTASLAEQMEESRAVLFEAGLPTDWRCPEDRPGESGLETLVGASLSFQHVFQGKFLLLVLVLQPSRIADAAAWARFLLDFARADLPPMLRAMVIDPLGQPLLGAIALAERTRIKTVAPELNMPAALEELAETAAGSGPGHVFRKLFIKLTNAAQAQDTAKARKIAASALKIARSQKWFDLQTTVQMVLGALHLGTGAQAEALKAYREAIGAADAAAKAGIAGGDKLTLHSRFALAAALINDGDFRKAAPLYETIASMAEGQEDRFLEVEAWRMAAYCHQHLGDPRNALRCGNRALQAGEAMDPELRPNSTLPFVGQQMLDLLHMHGSGEPYAQGVRDWMRALVGPDWQQKLPRAQDQETP